ncbi:MAG: Gfo/Idh/MocA family protein [Poseidonia sp.]
MSITIGLVGCGRWGKVHHATLTSLKEQGHLDRLVVCDIDEHALEGVVADRHYRSIEEMLAQEQLTGVAVVTPPETHLDLARQVVAVNLPVFVEKPLGSNSEEEVDFLATLPENTTMMVGYLLRHHAGLKRIKSAIEDHALNIKTISYRRRTTRQKPDGADPLNTLAVHGLDTARYLLGTSLARLDVMKLEITTSSANIWLRDPSSLITIDVAWEAEEEQRTLVVQGSTSGVVLDFGTGEVVWHDGDGVGQSPVVERFPSLPLEEQWRSFLRRMADGPPGIVPETVSLLDVSAWLAHNSPMESHPR